MAIYKQAEWGSSELTRKPEILEWGSETMDLLRKTFSDGQVEDELNGIDENGAAERAQHIWAGQGGRGNEVDSKKVLAMKLGSL